MDKYLLFMFKKNYVKYACSPKQYHENNLIIASN